MHILELYITDNKMASGNVHEFLAFEPTEEPEWRRRTNTTDVPKISQMLRDIVRYKERYEQLKSTSTEVEIEAVHKRLLVKFLLTIEEGEDIGEQRVGATESLMAWIDGESTPPVEENTSNATIETINLYKGYKYIKSETGEATDDEVRLMEVESLIKGTHKILMRDVMVEGTSPGQFSTRVRFCKFRGERHEFPKFENEAVAEKAVQTLVDKVNDMTESIKQMDVSEVENVKLYFKCSSKFLFCFLEIHPFADGNGRLSRLLSSYHLLTYSPFLTPIYNVFSKSGRDDYVKALVDASNGLPRMEPIATNEDAINLTMSIMQQKPEALCSLMIESNWAAWRQLLFRLGDNEIELRTWEENLI